MPAVPYRGPAGNFYWYDIVLEQQNRPNISCANFKTSLLTLMSHFCTNHFVHRNLTKYFSKKLKFFRVAHSKLGAKALSFSSSPHRTWKRWEDIFFSCSQKWTRKNPETVAASGFSGAISFLVAQCVMRDQFRCVLKIGKTERWSGFALFQPYFLLTISRDREESRDFEE